MICDHCGKPMQVYNESPSHKTYMCGCRLVPYYKNDVKITAQKKDNER